MLAEINHILIDILQRLSAFLTGIVMTKYLLVQPPPCHLIFLIILIFYSLSIHSLRPKNELQIYFKE